MCNTEQKPSYTSTIRYEQARIHAAAMYCSDGRVGEIFDDFLTRGLSLPRYDRIALPGGPASLAGHTQTQLEEKAVKDELEFLVEAHELDRVVLIQHEACAFYAMRLGLSAKQIEDQQRKDLVRAAEACRRITRVDHVEAYMALRSGDNFSFHRVSL